MPHARRRRHFSFHRWRVLVVEDDDSFAEALSELLEVDGRLEVAGQPRVQPGRIAQRQTHQQPRLPRREQPRDRPADERAEHLRHPDERV